MARTLASVSGNVHEATLTERRLLADDVEAFELSINDGATLQFRAGQFLSLRVGEDDAGAAILRSYSIASSSGKASVTLVVRRIDGGAAAAWFAALKLGAAVRFTGPMGFFVLDLAHAGDLVFGATGVGIAPVLPMIDEALARAEHGRVHLLWGNRARRDLFWQAELAARQRDNPRLSVRYFLSREPAGDGLDAGRITEPMFALLPALVKPTFYLVGSGAMISDVKKGLIERGVDRKRQIRNEAFFD
jgi:ferredoxin-NADP reductase